MAVDQKMRHRLHQSFEELWDADRAAAIMELVVPRAWEDLATKDDLQMLEYRLLSRMDRGEKRLLITLSGGLLASVLAMVGGMYAITQTIVNAL